MNTCELEVVVDTHGIIHEHSKIKLELYRQYLNAYLPILLNSKFFDRIFVHDIFAGSGISSNGEKGSAIIAATEIRKVLEAYPAGSVSLRLNEKVGESFDSLNESMRSFPPFFETFNQDANQYVERWRPIRRTHNFFFIDPHGYTQLSGENLRKLYSFQDSDYLIFLPISHIHRFLRKDEADEQLVPISKFLSDLGIGNAEAASVPDVEAFAQLVVNALKKLANTQFVYKQMLRNLSGTSQYCLIFASRHILGAHKFLEAQFKVREGSRAKETEPGFDFTYDYINQSIRRHVESGRSYDNVGLYQLGIEKGFLPKQINEELKELEDAGKITVTTLAGQKRQRGGFYIDNKHYKNLDRKISVDFSGCLGH